MGYHDNSFGELTKCGSTSVVWHLPESMLIISLCCDRRLQALTCTDADKTDNIVDRIINWIKLECGLL